MVYSLIDNKSNHFVAPLKGLQEEIRVVLVEKQPTH